MSTTSTNRNLLVIIGVLLLTNIGVLVYFLWLKSPEKPSIQNRDNRNGISDMLKKEVGFNDVQLAKYKELKDAQWNSIRPMFDDMRKVKDSLFRLLSNPATNDSMLDNAGNAIAQKQKALDLQTFNHFKKVRAICTSEQLPKYDSVIIRMFSRMGKQPRRTDKEEKK